MSAAEKAVGVVKSVLLFREMLDGIKGELLDLRSDLTALSRDHADLAERVAHIEGVLRGVAMASGGRPQLPDN